MEELKHITPETLAADIAASIVKQTATTTARDLEVNTLKINFDNMFKQNAEEHKEIKDTLKEVADKIEKLLDKMDGRYAKAWTEKAWIWAFSVIGVATIGIIVRWVILVDLK
jgi:hypothetical protein